MKAKEWKKQGQLVTVANNQLFVVDSGGEDKPVMVILHGYPTSSYDYHKVLPMLTAQFRVVIHDHLGFGFSDKPTKESYSLVDQCERALLLWRQMGIEQAHVVAHDYGTSVATELLVRHNQGLMAKFDPLTVTLSNGSMHVEMAQLLWIQKLLLHPWTGPILARMSNRKTLHKNIRSTFHDPSKVSDEELDEMWSMMMHNKGRRVIHHTTQYLAERYRLWHRWIGALQRTQLDVHVLWGEKDPVAVIEMVDVLSSEIHNCHLTLLEAGHFPMLETPHKWSNALIRYLLNA